MPTASARRVFSLDEITEPGDYFYDPTIDSDGERSLWFLLPTAQSTSPFTLPYSPHNGIHRIVSPTWTITENADGSISAEPSIGCGERPFYWHGYLKPGNVWLWD